jgi:hypothetical protein
MDRRLYAAKRFSVETHFGIDFATPASGTYTISPDEAQDLIFALQRARGDVLENSNPAGDPRLYDGAPA